MKLVIPVIFISLLSSSYGFDCFSFCGSSITDYQNCGESKSCQENALNRFMQRKQKCQCIFLEQRHAETTHGEGSMYTQRGFRNCAMYCYSMSKAYDDCPAGSFNAKCQNGVLKDFRSSKGSCTCDNLEAFL